MADAQGAEDQGAADGLVYCRRLERRLPVHDHLECPYCFGAGDDVSGGKSERFCDFEPGKDPVNFGFPPTEGGRFNSG